MNVTPRRIATLLSQLDVAESLLYAARNDISDDCTPAQFRRITKQLLRAAGIANGAAAKTEEFSVSTAERAKEQTTQRAGSCR
jgi:hypothetical protein